MRSKIGRALPVGKRVSLIVLHRHFAKMAAEATQDLGISPELASVLEVLVERGPHGSSALSKILSVDFSTAKRSVKRLVKRGLVERCLSLSGHKAVALTEKGRALSSEVRARWEVSFANVLEALPTLELRMALYDACALLASGMQGMEERKGNKLENKRA